MRNSATTLIALLAAVLCLASLPAAATPGLFSTQAGFYTEVNHFFTGPANGDNFGRALAVGDFNGDGVEDLATGIPYDDNFEGSGMVVVRNGVRGLGLAASDSTVLLPLYGGGDFGWSLAAGDFNADGYDDLAVGIPYGNVGHNTITGSVEIHYGSPSGLETTRSQYFDQWSPGLPGGAEFQGRFGLAVAAGDFDDDGFADLAIGHPDYSSDFDLQCGRVVTLYGTRDGLSTARSQMFFQDTPGMDGSAESNDYFGFSLAAGDFNGDGRSDLAVGVIGENDGGGVQFILGSATGLTVTGNNLWTQDDAGVSGIDEPDDQFGAALAVADFNGDGYDDVAVSMPYEDLDLGGGVTATDAGAVHIFFGSPGGPYANNSWLISSNTGVGSSEGYDVWGQALAAGDFNHDGYGDLAVAAPGEYVGSIAAAGEVTILLGSANGLTAADAQVWNQDTPGVPEASETGDLFGRALAAGDFDGNGYADLAIGGPGESTGTYTNNGAEWALYGALFADGFESGNTSKWQATQSSMLRGSNSVSANAAAKLGSPWSQYGLRVSLQDGASNPVWVMAGPLRGFADERTLKGSFFFDPQGLTMNPGAGLNVFQMINFTDGTGAGSKTRLAFDLTRSTTTWSLIANYWNDSVNALQFAGSSALAAVGDANGHNTRVDYEWAAGNPGRLTMWKTRFVNGAPDAAGRVQMFSVSLPGAQNGVINYVYAGMITGQDAGTYGPLYFDEFSFSR